MTAVNAPPTASVPGASPAIRSATRSARTTVASRIKNPTVPAVPASMRRNNAGPSQRAMERASDQPRITSVIAVATRIGSSSPNRARRYA